MKRVLRYVFTAPPVIVATTLLACNAPPASGPAAIAELAGRTAGPAQSCVSPDSSSSLRIANSRALLYGNGTTVWVNRLATECPGASAMDVIAIRPTGSQYCRGDVVQVLDPVSHVPGPSCVLGDFVPYRR